MTPDPSNARTHDARNLEAIRASLRAFGQQKPIVVDARGICLAGNGTLAAARSLGWETVEVVRSGLSPAEAVAYGIADNRTAELAEWDPDLLPRLLEGLDDEMREIVDFPEDELLELAAEAQGQEASEVEEVETPEADEVEAVTSPGDLWVLGDHRLLCGDSTRAEDVDRLMGGEAADLCFTSPPYGIGSSATLSGNTNADRRGGMYESHEDAPDQWPVLMDGWWTAFSRVAKCFVVNVQPLAGNKRELMRWIAKRADRLVDVAIWNKMTGAPQMSAGVLTSIFEFLLIFGDQSASRRIPFSSWHGTVGNVYDGMPQRSNEYAEHHAATMPTHLAEWVLGTLCDQTRTVVDPFAGTGTTAIVAEQMGKRSFGMEIDPRYCDVIVSRWESLTGKEASRDAGA